jgi:hypothetical protein
MWKRLFKISKLNSIMMIMMFYPKKKIMMFYNHQM